MRLQALVSNRGFLTLLFGALLVLPAFANQYTLFVGNLMLLYIILASGLNILVGFAGQLAFANAAIYGIGAYGTALLQVHLGWSFWAAAPVGAVLAMVIGTLLAFPALRLSGIFLALSTLAFAQATQWVLWHWESVTFGAGGFRTPPVDFGWLPIKPDYGIYFVSWAVTVVLLLFAWRIMRSRIGRAFVAMRDGEIAAQSLGIDLLTYKAMAFALSSFYAGAAGALYSALLGFVSPEGFDLFQMIIHKAMIVVGGLGSVVGSVLGASLLVYVMELSARVQIDPGDRLRRLAGGLHGVPAQRAGGIPEALAAGLAGAAAPRRPRRASSARTRRIVRGRNLRQSARQRSRHERPRSR